MKISVVTVSYNAIGTIENTIISVINQTYDEIEYIIIDGGSQDGTVDLIKKYGDRITFWVSEPDKGIYDAMNKALLYATGEWIIFMNAGDLFYDNSVIGRVFGDNTILNDINVVYGSTKSHMFFGNYIIKPASHHLLPICMPFCHQSIFVRTTVMKKYGFDTTIKLIADRKFLLDIYRNYPNSFFRVDTIISIYDAISGVSSLQQKNVDTEAQLLMGKKFSIAKKFKVFVREHTSPVILNTLYRMYFAFNRRYKRCKE